MSEKITTIFDEKRAFNLLCEQTLFGPRYPGSPAHILLIEYIKDEFGRYFPEVCTQPFEIMLYGKMTSCQNILGRIRGTSSGKKILLGTHFDTRPIADREEDQELRKMPILGANDGGSGTAVMLEIARILSKIPPPGDVIFAFFDAEDVGYLDGNYFYRGSEFFSFHMGDFLPDEVLILDMVGGKNMNLDIELNSLLYEPLYELRTRDIMKKLFTIARRFSYPQFYRNKINKFKYIECDHIPFLQMMIPAYILIDIDYPQWHTHKDLPEFCAPESLKAVGDVVLEYILNSELLLRDLHQEINRSPTSFKLLPSED